MKIEKISTHRLRNDAHFQFNVEFRNLVTTFTAETLGVKSMFDAYKTLLDKEDDALKKINKSSLTEEIRDADKARDETFVGLTKLNAAMLYHFNPAIKAAAKRIQIVLDTYGNVSKKPMNEQTSAIYNMLQELDLPKYVDDCINCNLNPWRNELKNRNESFEALIAKRDKETSSKSEVVMSKARVEVDNSYAAIIERINAAVIMEGEAKYADFVKQMDAIIARYKVKHHHHRKADDVVVEEVVEEIGD